VPDLPSGTVTFLFTDIEGSTRLLKQLRGRWGDVLAEHQGLLRAAFEEAGGHEIDTQGDSFFVAFRSAKDAVAAAVAGQRALASHDWPDDLQLRVRMGIHTGEPTVGSESYVGLGVHRAARIMAAGHGGQVLVSQSTRAVLEDDELDGALVRDLGEWQLKDLDRPEHIYQLEIDGLDNEFPPLKTLEGQPEQATPFEGREGELAEAAWRSFVQRGLRAPSRAHAVAAGILVAALGTTLFVILGSGSSQALSSVNANALGLISAKGNRLAGQVDVGASPSSVAIGQGAAWVTNVDEQTVSRIDLGSKTLRQTIPVGNGPSGIAADSRWVWVANSLDGTVSQIDPQTKGNEVVQTIPVGNGPDGIAVGAGSIWVANKNDGTVSRIDPRKGVVKTTVAAGPGASGIAVGAGAARGVWVANEVTGTLSRIDPSGKAGSQTIAVGNGPHAVAVGEGSVWVANGLDGTVMQIDPQTDTVRATILVGGASGIAVGSGAVWVTNEFAGTLSNIDPKTHDVRTIKVGNRPGGVAVDVGDVFVTVRAAGRAHRGGTLTLHDAPDSFDSLDPSRGYARSSWMTLITTNDGLAGFKRVGGNDGGQIVPDLAVSLPTPSEGGKTYTFQLRANVHFSTGALVRPRDVLRTFERSFQPLEFGPVFYGAIVGAKACGRRPAHCDLSAGIVIDDASRTVTFHLTEPDPDFLYKLALPPAFIVPAASPNGESRRPLPATGPYMVKSYTPKHGVRLIRNPQFREWSKAAQPDGYPDRIDWKLGEKLVQDVRAVERGTADGIFFVPVPPGLLHEMTTQYASQVHVSPLPRTNYLFLNTRAPPFDDVRVRRAVSYAVDRKVFVDLAGGPEYAQPTCQMLPPNFAGYRRYCPFTLNPSSGGFWTAPDLAKAQQLVRASGTSGMRVTYWSEPRYAADAPAVLSLLQRLGYKPRLKSFSTIDAWLRGVVDSRHKAQIGLIGWTADYPAPSEFSVPQLSCRSFSPRSSQNGNLAEFCDPKIDAEIRRALSAQASDPQAARALWAQVDRKTVDQAPHVPLTNPRGIDLVSPRVGNYQYNPQWGALIDQLWVH
jgi:YVTN family beta-propeller protein